MNISYLKNKKSMLNLIDNSSPEWDIFISAYNDNDRVKQIFDKINAKQKYWISLTEYEYTDEELPDNNTVIKFFSNDESLEIQKMIESSIGVSALQSSRVCIDITGFLRPYIIKLVQLLKCINVKKFDVLYTEPKQYEKKENTQFTKDVSTVRQILGYEGLHNDDVQNDVLIIGVGYDDELISRVINDKDGAQIIHMLSLPSLSADMYQESILRVTKNKSLKEMTHEQIIFAPANDPFVVAFELSKKIKDLRHQDSERNIYLSPLATKPQALGFALCYLNELIDSPASIIFPFSNSYNRETSKGLGRTWLYEVAL